VNATRAQPSPHPLRVSFIFEYARPADDWMMRSLIESLQTKLPGLRATCIHGVFATYRPGGLRPKRLANLAWVYMCTAFHLTLLRPDAVLVRSSPPGIQIWTVWWAGLRGVPVICWLMDYHPEIEARQLERRGLNGIARLVRRIDARSMRRFSAVVALDRSMSNVARERAAGVEVLEHPTWGGDAMLLTPVSYQPGNGRGPLHLAYSGNLGAAHDLTTLGPLLERLVQRRPVELLVIGASPDGIERFRILGESMGVAIVNRPRVPFAELREIYNEARIDAGIVLLSDGFAGLLSPSKFSGYINFGVPIVYIGPPDTNAADVCTRFEGGFWLQNHASDSEIRNVVNSLLDEGQMEKAARGARTAAGHFATLNHESLAALLAPRLRNRVPR
jgi:hypothetical protein